MPQLEKNAYSHEDPAQPKTKIRIIIFEKKKKKKQAYTENDGRSGMKFKVFAEVPERAQQPPGARTEAWNSYSSEHSHRN